ncbi:11592_t:CDS:10 [Ambispora leptoticha]|uniref:11592_t:CDS:1 n=1 Tax=Ambispora leptoticha TaxID=144679 RepID=A0A9N9AF57_9GLOM|nr:11592_t:CDS:10 [Ambispora leptoticha]
MSSPREQLLIILAQAVSQQQPELLKNAEATLKEWETAPEFHYTLLDIVYDKTIEQSIRFLAAIYLKNGIDKYWRKTAKNAIRPEEKAQIKSRLLSFMDEEINQLAMQNAILVSKIARLDYPKEWCDYQSRLIQKRLLLTLHLTVKALCSKTFAPDRKMLEQIAPDLLRDVGSVFIEHINRFYALFSSSNDVSQITMELETSILALKCIRRLITHGFQDITEVDQAKRFPGLLFDYLQKFFNLRISMQDAESPIFAFIESHITLIGKLYIDLQKTHPVPFALAPQAMEIVKYYWNVLVVHGPSYDQGLSTNSSPMQFEKFFVQALLLIKGVIKKSAYNQNPRGIDKSKIAAAIKTVDNEFLTPEFITSCAEILISRFLILTKEDLNMWEEDPEGWVNSSEADHWEYQLRPCAEKVFMELLVQNRELLSPLIIKLLENVASFSDENNLLLKDTVYSAVGLGSHELYDVLDFDSFLVNHLVNEVRNRNPSFKIIRRRIGWLIDEWDFDANVFSEYLDHSVTSLIQIIMVVEQFDTRMKILNCLSVIIERMEEKIAPFTQHITSLLPPLWEASRQEPWFKPSILTILTRLVGALKENSSNLQEFIKPLLQYSINPNIEESVYLLEDALDLWLAILQNTEQCTPLLFELVPSAIALLEFGSETLKRVLKILESYIILVPQMVIQTFGHSILDAFTRLLGDLKTEASNFVIHVIDTILQTCPIRLTGETLIGTGLLWKLMNIKQPYNVVGYISIFARVVISEPNYFLQFIAIAGQQSNTQEHALLEKVLDVWIERFDNIAHPKQRKLNAMAFTALIAITNTIILARLPQFISIWCDVLSEVRENGGGDALVYWEHEPNENKEFVNEEETAETKRRRALLQQDPVHSTNLIQYIQAKLTECETLNGGPDLFRRQYLASIDNDLLDQFYSLMS